MMDANEFVQCGGDVKGGLFLVDEERIRHPDVLDELRSDAQRLDAGPFTERQPWIGPELSEIEVQCEVLFRGKITTKLDKTTTRY